MLILTRVFCVLLYARVRPSDTAFETQPQSLGLHLEIQLSIQLSVFFQLICSERSSIRTEDFTVFEIFLCILFLTLMFIQQLHELLFLSIPLRIIVLLCVCDSVIDLFTVYVEFCQKFKLTIHCFKVFESDMCGFIVDLNGPKQQVVTNSEV